MHQLCTLLLKCNEKEPKNKQKIKVISPKVDVIIPGQEKKICSSWAQCSETNVS